MFAGVRSFVYGLLSMPAACPRCASADVRRSRRPSPLEKVQLYRYRCRACDHYFYLRRPQLHAVHERFWTLFRGTNGGADGRAHAVRILPARPSEPLDFDTCAGEAASRHGVDLTALDRDLARVRAELFEYE